MQLVSGKQAVQRIQNLVSEKHQVHAYAVELSAKQIYGLAPTGQVDFGGSEYVAAERQPVPTHQKHSQDKYQWWTLMHGAYLVEFNETLELAEDEIALLEPHERLLRAGAEHPSLYLRGKQNPLTILLSVSGAKMEVKQNARISTLRVFHLVAAPKAAKPPAKKKKR
ncbi:MAG: dCTP deaminase [Terriglobia bacterium]